MSRKSVFGVVFVATSVALGLYLSRGPWIAYRDQKAKADAATKEMLKAEREKTDLLEQKARAEDPLWREQQARDMGYLKKGEVPASTGTQQ